MKDIFTKDEVINLLYVYVTSVTENYISMIGWSELSYEQVRQDVTEFLENETEPKNK